MTELSSDNSSLSSSLTSNNSRRSKKNIDIVTNINRNEQIEENVSPLMKSPSSEDMEKGMQYTAAAGVAAATTSKTNIRSTTPTKQKSSKSKSRIEEDYGLPTTTTSSSDASSLHTNPTTDNLTTATTNNDNYESFPPRTPHLPENEYNNERSCCSHMFTLMSGVFILIHFACCLVAWIIPWWDAVVHLEVLKEGNNGGNGGVWKDWKEGYVMVLKDGSFSVILQNVKSSGSLIVLLLIILSAIILPTFCIIVHSILVFVVHYYTSYKNTILLDKPNNEDVEGEVVEEEIKEENVEEIERNTLLLEEERLVAPFTNAPTDNNNNTLTEPLLRPSSTTTENSIEIEELPPSSTPNTSSNNNNSKCSCFKQCLSSCLLCCTKWPKCTFSIYTVDITLLFFEIMYKFASCLVYVETIVFIATGGIVLFMGGGDDVHHNDENNENQALSIRASLINKARGGYIAYFLGINVGIIATVLLRAHLNHEHIDHKLEEEDEVDEKGDEVAGATSRWSSFSMVKGNENEMYYFDDTQDDDAAIEDDDEGEDEGSSVGGGGGSGASSAVKTPPISAFRISQKNDGNHSKRKRRNQKGRSNNRWNRRKKNASQQRTTLETMSLSSTGALVEEGQNDHQSSSSFLNPENSSITPSNQNNNNNNSNRTKRTLKETICTWKFWRNVLLFESGVFSFLFLLPTYSLPILRLNYDGLASTLMPDNTTTRDLTIWDIAMLVWSNPTNSNYFVRVLTTGFFWVNVIFCPIVALLCALVLRSDLVEKLAWCWRKITCNNNNNNNSNASSTKRNEVAWYRALQYTYPLASTSPFALCVLVAAVAMTDISLQIFDQDAFCRSANLARDCMLIQGKLLTGSWFCFLQAIFFDIFICMTLADLK